MDAFDLGSIDHLNDDAIEMQKKPGRSAITIWLSEDDKALYDLLKREYGVSVAKEMKKAMIARLNFLKSVVIQQKKSG